jgi:hypothetical protein
MNVSPAGAAAAGTVEGMTSTATALESARARTGGPRNTDKIVEHIAGWVFVVVLAMLVTQTGLM